MNVKHSLTLALVMADVLILGGTTPARVTKDGKAGDARKVGQLSTYTSKPFLTDKKNTVSILEPIKLLILIIYN